MYVFAVSWEQITWGGDEWWGVGYAPAGWLWVDSIEGSLIPCFLGAPTRVAKAFGWYCTFVWFSELYALGSAYFGPPHPPPPPPPVPAMNYGK